MKKIRHAIAVVVKQFLSSDFVCNLKCKLGLSNKFKVIDEHLVGESICTLKPDTVESLNVLKIYNYLEGGNFFVRFPKIDLWKIKDATIYYNSDVVTVRGNSAVWSKYRWYNFSRIIPGDSCLDKVNKDILYVKNTYKTYKLKNVFSLIGAHSHIWSHALSDYYTRLFYLEKVIQLAAFDLTVVIPNYDDQQLKDIVYQILEKYPNVSVFKLKPNEAVLCDSLYYIERFSRLTDHEMSLTIGDGAQPKLIANILKEQLVEPVLKNIDQGKERIKLFLPRRGMLRNITNYAEVEEYFRREGFVFLEEPHKLTFKEKIEIFNSASIIVGPFGSAFSNMLFCKPGTKVLIFNNNHRSYECWFCMHQDYFGMNILQVRGQDDKTASNPSHAAYYIPLETIKAAYNQLLNE